LDRTTAVSIVTVAVIVLAVAVATPWRKGEPSSVLVCGTSYTEGYTFVSYVSSGTTTAETGGFTPIATVVETRHLR
jgi:hypothetical protein